MIKEYRKIATIKAERFDGTNEMVKKYNMHLDRGVVPDESGDDFGYFKINYCPMCGRRLGD